MPPVRFGEQTLTWEGDDSLLDLLERSGVAVPSSCRSGVCQSCMVRAVDGHAPAHAQEGLRETWKQQGYFLSCMCRPPEPLNVALIDQAAVSVLATCVMKEQRSEDVVRFRLRPEAPFDWRPGQFANLVHNGLVRSYSIASLPSEGALEFHVRKVPGGRMSNWLYNELHTGSVLTVRGPSGDCFYVGGRTQQPLVLFGTGTGLAPLWAVARDALAQGHTGPIHLLHGGRTARDLYLDAELKALAAAHPTFKYHACLTDAEPSDAHHKRGRVHLVSDSEVGKLQGHRVFVCGSPPMVKTVKQHAYRSGADKDDILADAFIPAPIPQAPPPKPKRRSLKVLAPEPKPKHAPWQKLRFAVQALVLTGFLTQGILYYTVGFRPLGNLLPFMAYDSLGHMMVSSALLVWAALFLLAMVFGRFMCGWLCPLGFLQDAGEKLLRRVGAKLPRPVSQPRLVRLALACLVVGHFAVLPLLATPVRLWQLDLHFREPWLLGFPFRAGLFALDLLLVFVVIGLILPLFFGPRPYCKMVCETGYLLDRAASFSFGRIRRNHGFDQDTCLSCGKCTAICPQGIAVHEEVHLFDRVVNSNCISCLQCVHTCPNDTIIYSLKKRVADTGKVAGYLASLNVRAEDLPRHAVTGLGVLVGAYVGFRLLPPSYFHTYLLFASLGGLTGHLLSPRVKIEKRSLVEKETADRVLPLTPQERAALSSSKRHYGTVAVMIAAYVGLALAAWAIVAHLPPRIGMVSDLRDHRVIYFGVPPTLSEQDQHRAFGSLHHYLSQGLGREAQVVGAETYGQLAQALEQGRIDAAILPAGTAAALLGRQARAGLPTADPVAQVEIDGRTTFTGALMTLPDGPHTIRELRGKRLAITSLDSVSGFLAPMSLLREHELGALDLSEIVFAGSAQRALGLLESGRVDVAAAFDGAIDRYKRLNPSAPLVTLTSYDGLLGDIVLARPDFPLRDALRHLLLNVHDDPRVADDLRAGSVTGFFPWDPARFVDFRTLID